MVIITTAITTQNLENNKFKNNNNKKPFRIQLKKVDINVENKEDVVNPI